MSARTAVAVLAVLITCLASVPSGAANGVCKNLDWDDVHVGIAFNAVGDTCHQQCRGSVSVNVAVTVIGDVHQCSTAAVPQAADGPPPPPESPCVKTPPFLTAGCYELLAGLRKAVACLQRPDACNPRQA